MAPFQGSDMVAALSQGCTLGWYQKPLRGHRFVTGHGPRFRPCTPGIRSPFGAIDLYGATPQGVAVVLGSNRWFDGFVADFLSGVRRLPVSPSPTANCRLPMAHDRLPTAPLAAKLDNSHSK